MGTCTLLESWWLLALIATVLIMREAPAADRLTPIDLRQIEIGGEIGRRIDITVNNNLLKLDPDGEFLKPFQERSRSGGFIGLGMLIDSAARLAAYTGDEKVIELKEHLVRETIKNQQPDGYIGIVRPDSRMWQLWDIHEMAYLVHGLLSDYQLFDEKPSLEAAEKVADYVVTRWSAEPEKIPGGGRITVVMAVTGLEPALLRLYDETGRKQYLELVLKLRKLPEWDGQIVLGRWGPVGGHAYAHCSRCIAQLWLHRMQPNPKLLEASHRVIEFLANGDGMAINGACGYRECWHDSQDGTSHLGETCATAYLLRLYDELIRMEGRSLYGDLMERAIYNALPAAQSPDGRRLRYYVPLEGPRIYFPRDSYCCPNNFRRVISELPEMVYYRSGGGLTVNLYTPSTAKVKLGKGISLTVRQQTDYPNSGRVAIHIDPSKPAEFTVQLRIPRWCKQAKVAVNGQPIKEDCPGGAFFALKRQWKPGDRIELEMPMAWRFVKGRKAQSGRAAVMRGPMAYCLNRSRHKELKDTDLHQIVIVPSTLEGPFPDDSVRPDGQSCRIRAWSPSQWYPHTEPKLKLVLSELADPHGEHTYFKVANLRDEALEDDDLINIDLEKAK